MRSGDLGRIDGEGRLHILGRSKELIIHGGFNVYPPEVEAALNDHPKVIQSAVIGRMQDGDEKVLAFVQVAPGDLPDPEELRRFVAARLTGYKRPSRIIVATELPAAATGKILKHKLLEHFEAELAATAP
jgi:acyl-CoA synthetase (AMP-forming)/AMP-acid ligase II